MAVTRSDRVAFCGARRRTSVWSFKESLFVLAPKLSMAARRDRVQRAPTATTATPHGEGHRQISSTEAIAGEIEMTVA